MSLPPLHGHDEARLLLARAARSGSLPQSILLHGPAGVGKERLGLWLAQLLVCEAPEEEGPCDRCRACRHTLRLEHPDVHWFFPLPRPAGAASPEKLRERLEEDRAEELRQRRENPLRVTDHEKAPAYYLAAIRSLQRLASMRPSHGSQKVFVVGDAELMVPQESAQEAANAFLKLLEEPPPATTLVLTSSQPGALLPTIRSRVLSLRVGRLDAAQIEQLITNGGLASGDAAAAIARRAAGSARRALRIAANPEAAEASRAAGRELLLAALASSPVARLAAANERKPAGARAELTEQLDSLNLWLRDLLAVLTGAEERVSDPDALPILRRAATRRTIPTEGVMRSLDHVAEAHELAYGNVNPQLIVAELLMRMSKELQPRRSSPSAQAAPTDARAGAAR